MKKGYRRKYCFGTALMCGLVFWTNSLQAGMTVYELTDVVRLRLEDISFFLFLLLMATLGIRFLWNYVAKDILVMPKLSFLKALSLTLLLSLFMLLVLVMIAGARELLTPGGMVPPGKPLPIE